MQVAITQLIPFNTNYIEGSSIPGSCPKFLGLSHENLGKLRVVLTNKLGMHTPFRSRFQPFSIISLAIHKPFWLWVKTLVPCEYQTSWQMDVHPPNMSCRVRVFNTPLWDKPFFCLDFWAIPNSVNAGKARVKPSPILQFFWVLQPINQYGWFMTLVCWHYKAEAL